ncbi:MAG: glycoside hydrolase family 15 protein [Phycisphaerae bacterium]|nr:glycoside hydrolase family 15 protein [Phycisphaerae bacterium]
MPRNIPVGNGEMLVAFDDLYQMRDIYWPRVGMPNHTCGHPQRFGVWVDGQFAWIEDPAWVRELRYKPDTLVTEVRLRHDLFGIEVTCNDVVDYWSPVFIRRVRVADLFGRARDVRLFFHHDLSVQESPVGDTVNYDPSTGGMIHYKDQTYFLVNGCDARRFGVEHWAAGQKRIGDAEGTWRDAEDGLLSRNAIAQGSVDSTVGLNVSVPAWGTGTCHYWIAAGHDYQSVKALNEKIREKTPQRMVDRSEAYWRLWACKEPVDFSALPENLRDLYVRSQLILRTQIDNGGAIIAANDHDITHFAGDTYSYMWPRDGALAAYALVLSGHSELSRNFFRFCERVIGKDGYFLHKYHASGSLASSWHPWMLDGQKVLPIQQDETALVVWALRKHFQVFRDVEFIKNLYNTLVVEPATWMLRYRDHNGLPLPSWDLWEERRGVHLFTVASTIGALKSAAAFAHDMGAFDRAAEFNEGAERMRGSMIRHMWDADAGRFARTATPQPDGTYRLDMTLDASAFSLFAFGAMAAGDPKVTSHMQQIRDRLWVRTEVGGLARYERDYYHQVEKQNLGDVPGNPWAICTLWYAQWLIEKANNEDELRAALPYLEWCGARAFQSGVLAEQFDPYTGAAISVSPLTWSHATVMIVVMKYLLRHARMTGRSAGSVAELSLSAVA